LVFVLRRSREFLMSQFPAEVEAKLVEEGDKLFA
jgi:hypothetical protein